MKYKLLKVGSDAELFLLKAGQPYPVCGLVGGTKQDPLPVLGGNGYAVQEDNVTLEFNIPPASTAEEFQQSIGTMLAHLQGEMAEKELVCHSVSEAIFQSSLLEQFPQAHVFGCEPDFCVWTKSVNPMPEFMRFPWGPLKTAHEFRCAGFHIHVSYTVDDEPPLLNAVEALVKAQDIFLGVPLTLRESGSGQRIRRRQSYGRAGAFRLKPYGHEYRVLGSAVLTSHPVLNRWIFDANQRAMDFLNNNGDAGLMLLDQWGKTIRAAINDSHMDSISATMANFAVPPLPAL